MKLHISSEILLWFGLLVFGMSGFFLTVFFSQPQGFYAFVMVAALGGLGVSSYISYSKWRGKQLVCSSGGDCNVVIRSRYAKFFGIPLEYLGILYFAGISLSYGVMLLAPETLEGVARVILMLFSVGASLFSAYLLFVQAFLLRKWCIWCVLAAMFSLTVFFFALVSFSEATTFLARIETVLTLVKFVGFMLGVGGVTWIVVLFVRFLQDADIDEKEVQAIKNISEFTWIGLGLCVMSQFALYVANPTQLLENSSFLAGMIALFGAAFAGAVFMIIYAPFLAYVPFEKKPQSATEKAFAVLRRPTFMVGALALFSWYFAFVSNFIPEYSLVHLLVLYGTVLALATIGTLLWGFQYRER